MAFRYTFLQAHYSDGFFWVRVFGVGFVVKDETKHKPLFSERNKIRKSWRIGKWALMTLT